MSNELELIRRTQEGDAEAFRSLYETHVGPVFGAVYRLVGNPDDANEIVQDTFVRAYRSIGTFRGHARFSTWLYRIAMNLVYDLRRRQARDRQHLTEMPTDPLPAPDRPDALARTAARILAALPAEHRDILVLREQQGLSYVEIARVLGCRLGTVRSRLARARQEVRARYGSAARIMKESR